MIRLSPASHHPVLVDQFAFTAARKNARKNAGENAGKNTDRPNGQHSQGGWNVRNTFSTSSVPMSTTEAQTASSWPSARAAETAFGTVDAELAEVVATVKNGVLPPWLNGRFYRNGPGTYENGTPEGMLHLFDGYGMLVKVELRGQSNEATVSNMFVRSSAYTEYKRTGKMAWREFGTARKMDTAMERAVEIVGTIGGALGLGETKGVTDNASVHVIERVVRDAGDEGNDNVNNNGTHKKELWAMTETVPGTFGVDPATLATTRRVGFADGLEGTLTTAHPTVDADGTMVNLLSVPGKGFTVYEMADDGRNVREEIARVPHARPLSPAWVHDFPGCPEAVVVPETPLYFNLASLTLGLEGSHLFMDWIPEDGTTLHVVDREDGNAVSTVTGLDPFFVFHWANAYVEIVHDDVDGSHRHDVAGRRLLHLDACVYDDPDIVEHLLLGTIRRGGDDEGRVELPASSLRRLTLEKVDVPSGTSRSSGSLWRATTSRPVSLSEDESRDFGGFTDFPTVSSLVKGRKHRFVWLSGAVRPTNVTNALVKFDVEAKTSVFWHEPGALPGESCFVARPGAVEEDDGVILSSLIEADGSSCLLVLDARTMHEVCRVGFPDGLRVPSGFHGTWVWD